VTEEVLAIFKAHVTPGPQSECWVWTGRRDAWGYGRINKGTFRTRAHRLSWELSVGPIPSGVFVCHRCDNPPCVNPSHLFLGTSRENTADMVAKGRQARGERKNTAKLTEKIVEKIRHEVAAGLTYRQAALKYGVGFYSVRCIVRGKTWRHTYTGPLARVKAEEGDDFVQAPHLGWRMP
jgi:hypothetical protein